MRRIAMKSVRIRIVLALALLAVVVGAAPALALVAEEPAPTEAPAAEERVAEDPAAPVAPNEGVPFIAPPDIQPVDTEPPPKIDAADFGVGWPAAIAVGVALLAVLLMALTWKREEVA